MSIDFLSEREKKKNRKFFLHNWLVNLSGMVDKFKENDLLQEHQNFWVKVQSEII